MSPLRIRQSKILAVCFVELSVVGLLVIFLLWLARGLASRVSDGWLVAFAVVEFAEVIPKFGWFVSYPKSSGSVTGSSPIAYNILYA